MKDIDINELAQVISDALRDWWAAEDEPIGGASRFIAERVLAHLTDGDK